MEAYQIVVAGLISGAAMALWSMMMNIIGLSKVDMVAYLGGLLTDKVSGMMSFMMGMLMHFVISLVFSFLYFFALMHFFNMVTWQHGMMLGLLHWIISGSSLPFIDEMNSCVKAKKISALGYFAQDYGTGAAMVFFIGHLMYGGLIGYFLA